MWDIRWGGRAALHVSRKRKMRLDLTPDSDSGVGEFVVDCPYYFTSPVIGRELPSLRDRPAKASPSTGRELVLPRGLLKFSRCMEACEGAVDGTCCYMTDGLMEHSIHAL